jgi:LPS export ABC transporter protein LptC
MNLFFPVSFRLKKRFLPFILLFLYFACTKTQEVDLSKKKNDFPSRTLINAHVIYKDSGRIVLDLESPRIEEYAMIDSPYTKFPNGVHLFFYNKNRIDSPGFLRADWGIMSEIKGLYQGRGNVVVISDKGDTLKSEQLFWNKKSRKIYTRDTVYIISKDGDSLQANNGLEAKDDLSEYILYNNSGIKFYEEEKN